MDDLGRADLGAQGAVGALGVIDHRMVVDHVDRVELAGFFTEFAGDAADGADLGGGGAGVDGAAAHDDPGLVRHDLDQFAGAGFGAEAAADAHLFVDDGDAVLHFDRAVLADRFAVAEAHAGHLAGTAAPIEELVRLAGLVALVVHGIGGLVPGAGTFHDGDPGGGAFEFDSQDLADRQGDGVAAGGAEVRLYLVFAVFRQDVGVVLAAGVAAGAAVGAGQGCKNFGRGLVHLYGHEAGGDRQDPSGEEAEAGYDADRQ